MKLISFLLLNLLWLTSSHGQTKEKLNWERPVFIGASVTDGFHLEEKALPFFSPISKSLGLDHFLDNTLIPPHGRTKNFGSKFTSLATEPHAKYQAKAAHNAKPTVLFAIDYLFWYLSAKPEARGPGLANLTRLEFLELGLAHLATFKCPVVVGNIPDAVESINVVISYKQYPGVKTIAQANQRITDWQKKHPNVSIIDLHQFHQSSIKNRKIKLPNTTLPAGKSRSLLHWDGLHPNSAGARALLLKSLQALGVPKKQLQ